MNTKKTGFRWSFIFVAILAILCAFLLFDSSGNDKDKTITVDQAISMIDVAPNSKISNYFVLQDGYKFTIYLQAKNNSVVGEKDTFPKKYDYIIKDIIEVDYLRFNDAIAEYNDGILDTNKILGDTGVASEGIWNSIMPILYIVFALILIFFVFKMFSSNGKSAMSFGKSRAKATTNVKVRFDDVAGADEEKQELAEIVEFLKNPQKFTELGARIPKGVLLVGNPGTGKTLLARAVAGESNVPFLSISGSDFVEMFVGVGASRVRDLFDQAKRSAPCIVFIDEIDAVGRQRGAGLGGGNDEREQTLNQLLVEMDGFEANEGIIVLAATNRADVLDPALLRPGRFDRQVYVHSPDVKGREGIIKIHAKNKPIDDEVNFTIIARMTSGFTGADLENMLNEAAILAARASRPKILMVDILEGINKVLMGPQKKSLIVTDRDKKITAYHESGHALLGKKLKNCEQVQEVSIIPRGMAAGYTMSRPENDDNHMTYNKLNDTIAMIMGGRISEELFMEDISTGASNDIKRATEIARKMVTEWGMSEKFGFMSFGADQEVFLGRDYQSKSSYSELTAGEIDNEVKKILDRNYARAKKIIKENENLIVTMSELLLEKETIYKEEVDMIMQGKSKEEIIEYMEQESKRKKEKEEVYKKEIELARKIKDCQTRIMKIEMLYRGELIKKDEYEKNVLREKQEIAKIEEERKTLKNELTTTNENNVEELENNQTEQKEEKPKRTTSKPQKETEKEAISNTSTKTSKRTKKSKEIDAKGEPKDE